MKTDGQVNILSGLKYHGRAVLIAHIDAERFFLNNSTGDCLSSFTEPNKLFTKKCLEYRRRFRRLIEDVAESSSSVSGLMEEDIAHYLYNPVCFTAFGDNDNIAIVGIDELEAGADLSSLLIEVPVRQTCLAFCPELSSLGLKAKKYGDIFCELEDVYKDSDIESKRLNYPSTIASCKEFLSKRPLLAVSYFKLNTMAILGPGLMMQEYTYKVMADRIAKTLEELRKNAKKLKEIIPYEEHDIDSFRCMFLDPQGWSDIATLMFCRNYSVIAAVAVALRSLTMGDLYKIDTLEKIRSNRVGLKEAVKCFGIHKQIAERGKKKEEEFLIANHVFCSTYTTVGMYEKAFEKETVPEKDEDYHYNGLIIADSNLNVCAGHGLDIKRRAEELHASQVSSIKLDNYNDYVWFLIGHNDFVYQQLADSKRDVDKAIRLADFIKEIKLIRCNNGRPDTGSGEFTADVLDTCSDLRIPVPILSAVMTSVEYDKHIETKAVWERLRRSLFEDDKGFLSIVKLRKYMNILRIPPSLSTAILYLYTDFANYLSDPFLFDSILDLYDVISALRTLLIEELPMLLKKRLVEELKISLGDKWTDTIAEELFSDKQEQLNKELQQDIGLKMRLDSICLSFLGTDDLENLVELTDLLQNALGNRIQITFNAAERWNATVDVRGIGLDRIISAADAPLKCGLGILRRIKNHVDKQKDQELSEYEIDLQNKQRIGGASKISYHPRCFSKRLMVGNTPNIFIGSVDINLAHLTQPHSFYIHLHETAHLISCLLGGHEDHEKACSKCAANNTYCHRKSCDEDKKLTEIYLERYQEIFAEMFVHRFVFEDAPKLFFRNYVANYSLDPINSVADDDEETFDRMLEVFVRGFLASEPFRKPEEYSSKSGFIKLTPEASKNALKRFWAYVEDAGPILSNFQQLWHGEKEADVKKFVDEQFQKIYSEAYHPVCCIRNELSEICDSVVKENYPKNEEVIEELAHQIENGLKEGRPIVRVQYKEEEKAEMVPEKKRLDTMFIVSNLLRKHIETLYGGTSMVVYLHRRTNGKPNYTCIEFDGKMDYKLLDRHFSGIISITPAAREQSMRNRIAIIKTLWDISTTLRARRLKDILLVTNGK